MSSRSTHAAEANSLAQVLLPDILTYDYSSPKGYLNGRRLGDDVIDISLNLVTKGKVTTDHVGPCRGRVAGAPAPRLRLLRDRGPGARRHPVRGTDDRGLRGDARGDEHDCPAGILTPHPHHRRAGRGGGPPHQGGH